MQTRRKVRTPPPYSYSRVCNEVLPKKIEWILLYWELGGAEVITRFD